MALTEKQEKKLIETAHALLKKAKFKKDVSIVFLDEEVGYLVLGYKKLSRLMLGWTAEEVIDGKRQKPLIDGS